MKKLLKSDYRIEFLLLKTPFLKIFAVIIFLFNFNLPLFAQEETPSSDEIDEIKKSITKAGNVNKTVKLDGGVDIGRDLTQFKNNPTKNNPTPKNSLIESSGTSLSVGITTKPEASTAEKSLWPKIPLLSSE